MNAEVYLVTGASGFVGSRLTDRLLALRHKVAAVGRRNSWAQDMRASGLPNLTVFQGDLTDKRFVESIWDQAGPFDGIFHYAAQLPAAFKGLAQEYNMVHYVHSNVLATATLLDIASRHEKVRFVYGSTISVFGRVDRLPIDEAHPTSPTDLYGLTKLLGEECVRFAASCGKLHGITLRFPGMIGIGNDYGAVHLYTDMCLQGQPVSVYGDGKPQKDYIAVEDVVEASILAMKQVHGFDYEVFNVGGCQPGVPPPPLAEIARMVVEACGGGQVLTNNRNPAEPVNMYFDNLKANRVLGYSPRPLSERIREYVTERKATAEAAHSRW